MEDSVGDLFTKEESHEVFWPFFYVRVLLSMHFMKSPMIKTNKLPRLVSIRNKKLASRLARYLILWNNSLMAEVGG